MWNLQEREARESRVAPVQLDAQVGEGRELAALQVQPQPLAGA